MGITSLQNRQGLLPRRTDGDSLLTEQTGIISERNRWGFPRRTDRDYFQDEQMGIPYWQNRQGLLPRGTDGDFLLTKQTGTISERNRWGFLTCNRQTEISSCKTDGDPF